MPAFNLLRQEPSSVPTRQVGWLPLVVNDPPGATGTIVMGILKEFVKRCDRDPKASFHNFELHAAKLANVWLLAP